MTKDELLALPNCVLALLYSEWSERTYAASWYQGGEPQFLRAILTGKWSLSWDDEDGAAIRHLLEAMP